jgi:hypothetical protein
MSESNKIVIALRVISFIIGGAILAWFGYMYIRAITLYGPGINFWYFTSSSMTNFGLTALVHLALFVLVGMALYPGKTPVSFVLILTGTSCLAVGRALMTDIGSWFFYAINPLLGMVLMVVGILAIAIAGWMDSKRDSAKQSTPPTDTAPALGE